jgi:ribonuclease P protein component
MLPSDQRLRANKDFRSVYARAKSHVHPLAVIYALRRTKVQSADADQSLLTRFGFVVSKKQGCAVIRNRIKRRLREAVQARIQSINGDPYDVVFVARERLYTAEWQEVIDAVDDLLRRSGLIRPAQCTSQPTVVKP